MTGLTERQRDVWKFFREFQAAHYGIPPSFREVMEKFGMKSTEGVAYHVRTMLKKGAMVRALQENESRGIVAIEFNPDS